MSAPAAPGDRRLRVPIEDLAEGERSLSKEAATYVTRVHRLGAGDAFVVFDPERAIEASAHIVFLKDGGRAVSVRIDAVRPASVRAARPVTLVQSLGKGDKMDAIVRDATELGATRIVPVIAERSVARPDDAAGRARRWRRLAIEAARQCGRGDVPAIEAPEPLLDAIPRLAAPRLATNAPTEPETETETETDPAWGACLVPGAPSSLGDLLQERSPRAPVTIVVGPEGGLSPAEIAACEAAGLPAAGLGPFVLRTETVCAAVLGALLIHAARA